MRTAENDTWQNATPYSNVLQDQPKVLCGVTARLPVVKMVELLVGALYSSTLSLQVVSKAQYKVWPVRNMLVAFGWVDD